jgi:hypothetical protein
MDLLSGHTTPQAKPFWNIARYFTTPTQSVPPLFDHGVQVFNSVDKTERLTRHFERIHYPNLNVGTANQALTVRRTVNKYLRRPHPYVTEARLTNPSELRCLIQALKIRSAPGTDGISATVLQSIFRKALIHLNKLFNHILRF